MYKQIIVIRTDLDMGKGKLAAQCCHASLGAYKKTLREHPEIVKHWELEGQQKVVLKVTSGEQLIENFQHAKDKGFPVDMIRDAGRTQIDPGTITCFAAGPWKEEELDQIYGKLKLL
ncbi:MAG: peptidyl-tRNA hydrolase Pth2 [Candidatus Micrarchaeota archaeon]